MVLLRKRKDLMSGVESGLQVFFAYRKQKKPLLGERYHRKAMAEMGDNQYKTIRKSGNSSPLSVALTGASSPPRGASLRIYRKR